jgi:hypothetical protein
MPTRGRGAPKGSNMQLKPDEQLSQSSANIRRRKRQRENSPERQEYERALTADRNAKYHFRRTATELDKRGRPHHPEIFAAQDEAEQERLIKAGEERLMETRFRKGISGMNLTLDSNVGTNR